jgi:hypothetical protein
MSSLSIVRKLIRVAGMAEDSYEILHKMAESLRG